MTFQIHSRQILFFTLIAMTCSAASVRDAAVAATINDFATWTQVADPPHPGMTGMVDNASQVTLTATPPSPPTQIPAGTDIGYQSVNGLDVAGSTSGFFFSPLADFAVAVDFNVTHTNSVGFAGIGFGIGEDQNGVDSAGMGLAINNGAATAFAGAARIADATQAPLLFGTAGSTSGRMFVTYHSASGDVEVGISTAPGAATPTETQTFAGLQNSWNDAPLLVSFFLRSDTLLIFDPLSDGTLNATFSNFEIVTGSALPVPEPTSAMLIAMLIVGMVARRVGPAHR